MNFSNIEAKIITHLSKKNVGEDIHIVKEVTVDENNNYIDDIRIIKNFQRPFWVTKPIYRNHTDKKESEDMSKVDMFKTTQSDMSYKIASRLDSKYVGITDLNILRNSPYLYGIDVDSRTFLKKWYMKKNDNLTTPYRVGAFDIEVDVLTNKIIVATLATHHTVYTFILKDLVKKSVDPINKIKRLYDKYIPNIELKNKVKLDLRIFDNEIDLIKAIFKEANYAKIDFLAIWNITYDVGMILDLLERHNIDPADVFHYDKIPEKYKYFKFKEAKKNRTTASGKFKPVNPEEQWNVVTSTTNYYFIDAMSAHRYVRVGGKTVPGGYSLDNILKYEGIDTKLRFDTDDSIRGIEWHIHMVKNKPLEYIVYNMWDTMSMLMLDKKTKDLEVSLPLLSGVSHFDIFNSGPRRIIDALLFFYLTKNKVLGTKPSKFDDDKLLGLDNWIVTLPGYRIDNNGLRIIKESDKIETNIRTLVYDADAVSSYPSNIMAANVSTDTTHRELLSVGNIPKELFKLQNINLLYGATNAIEYCTNMFNFPTVDEMYKLVKEKITT